jgi:hypothetical protein
LKVFPGGEHGTVLETALHDNMEEIVTLILSRGADPETSEIESQTSQGKEEEDQEQEHNRKKGQEQEEEEEQS